MRSLIEWAGEEWGERIAYSYRISPFDTESVKVSFNTLRRDVRSLSSKLISMCCTGRHCAVIGKMSYEWVLLYFSLMSIGAVMVPLDKDWKGEELANTAETADVSFLFCDEDIKDKAELERLYKEGAHKAECIANRTLGKVMKKVGFIY